MLEKACSHDYSILGTMRTVVANIHLAHSPRGYSGAPSRCDASSIYLFTSGPKAKVFDGIQVVVKGFEVLGSDGMAMADTGGRHMGPLKVRIGTNT
jgi:hypothetical protein